MLGVWSPELITSSHPVLQMCAMSQVVCVVEQITNWKIFCWVSFAILFGKECVILPNMMDLKVFSLTVEINYAYKYILDNSGGKWVLRTLILCVHCERECRSCSCLGSIDVHATLWSRVSIRMPALVKYTLFCGELLAVLCCYSWFSMLSYLGKWAVSPMNWTKINLYIYWVNYSRYLIPKKE